MPLILGLAVALAGGGGGFFAAYSGMIQTGREAAHDDVQDTTHDGAAGGTGSEKVAADVAFVPVDPMVVSLGGLLSDTHLRFRAQLEVPTAHRAEVEALMPRIVDVLHTYLRALELSDLEARAALVQVRAHMLHRVQIVAGEGRISDLLVMEFVMN
jgi:flagellar FliL protein